MTALKTSSSRIARRRTLRGQETKESTGRTGRTGVFFFAFFRPQATYILAATTLNFSTTVGELRRLCKKTSS